MAALSFQTIQTSANFGRLNSKCIGLLIWLRSQFIGLLYHTLTGIAFPNVAYFGHFLTLSGIKYAFIIYSCSYFVNVYYICGNSTRTLTIQNSVPVRVVYLARCKVCGYPCNGFLFIFVSIKLSTPLIQAHFAESFRPVVRFVVILAAGFFLFIFTFVSFMLFT